MLKNDILCRAAVYPRFLKDGQFDNDALINFSKGIRHVRALSLASRWLCRCEERVHKFGREVATKGNLRRAKDGYLDPNEKQYYLGYYCMRYGLASKLGTRDIIVEVYWKPEEGLSEHFQLDLVPCLTNIHRRVKKAIKDEASIRKTKHPPNLDNRIKKEIDKEVRMIRTKLANHVFGRILDPVERTNPRWQLQLDLMPLRSEV